MIFRKLFGSVAGLNKILGELKQLPEKEHRISHFSWRSKRTPCHIIKSTAFPVLTMIDLSAVFNSINIFFFKLTLIFVSVLLHTQLVSIPPLFFISLLLVLFPKTHFSMIFKSEASDNMILYIENLKTTFKNY